MVHNYSRVYHGLRVEASEDALPTMLTSQFIHVIVDSMKREGQFLRAFSAVVALLLFGAVVDRGAYAQGEVNGPPPRQATLEVAYTQYEWWVIRWVDNAILCQVFIDHEGLPVGDEILADCGSSVYSQWRATPPCQLSSTSANTSECPGVYLFFIGSKPATKTILVDLPPPVVWVELRGCIPTIPENRCDRIPSLLLVGEEPLPNETITAIHAVYNGRTYVCPSDTCEIPLQPTGREGATIEFWADSSFGDSSQHFTAQIRIVDTGVSPSPGGAGWYVDVVSSQWRGRQLASCAQTWQAFPSLGGLPAWLTTPEIPELLASAEPYYFLAGQLIRQGVVDASGCPNGGLLPNGYADECGLERAMPVVLEWQNQFDARIIEVSSETGVPAQLMKNLFAQESQFWPGAFAATDHIGLGHITEKGADTLLLWNRSFYRQFCPLVLDEEVCQGGYLRLSPELQAILRGALAGQAEAECPDCPTGIDLTNANFSIELFASTLLANCEQVGQIVFNASKRTPGTVSSYEDLWRMTLANYHAGPGCLSYAVHTAFTQRGAPLTWETVSTYFTPACQGVVGYVENIAR